MKKLLIIVIVLSQSIKVFAQKEKKQDIGINMAGLLVKNQATISPSIIYKYKIKNCQLRFQLAIDGNLNSKKRNGLSSFDNGPFGSFSVDSAIDFDPGKIIRYGLMAGIQKNTLIDNTPFSYYFGLDIIFMMSDFSQSGKGVVTQGNKLDSFNRQKIDIKVSTKNKLNTFGIGIPVGITYKFGKKLYTSLEAKFVIVYQKQKDYLLMESYQISQMQEIIQKIEGTTYNKGFDFGIKPLTGLCIGIIF